MALSKGIFQSNIEDVNNSELVESCLMDDKYLLFFLENLKGAHCLEAIGLPVSTSW